MGEDNWLSWVTICPIHSSTGDRAGHHAGYRVKRVESRTFPHKLMEYFLSTSLQTAPNWYYLHFTTMAGMAEVTHLRSPSESGAKLGKEATAPRAKSKAPTTQLQRWNQESKKNPRVCLEPAGLSTMQLLLSDTDSLNNRESLSAETDCSTSLLSNASPIIRGHFLLPA